MDFFQGVKYMTEVCILCVGLVDDKYLGDIPALGCGKGLFSTDVIFCLFGVGDNEHAAGGAGRLGETACKVKETGSVDEVDLYVIPLKAGDGTLQRDFSLLLLGVVVHDGAAVLDLAKTTGGTCGVEHGLAQGRLTTVGVAGHCNVPNIGGLIRFQGGFLPGLISLLFK